MIHPRALIKNRLISPSIAACLVVLWIAATAQPLYSQTATIGAWNIQYLGSPGCRPNATQQTPQTADDLADFIIASQVDVLGLEEITDNDGISQSYTNRTLNRVMNLIRTRTGNTWQYMLFKKFEDGQGCKAKNVQLVGIAWNTNKASRIGFTRIPIDTSSVPNNMTVWNRHPYAIKFRFGQNRTDVVLIVVHMKSNVGNDTEVTREWEARLLMEQLDFIRNYYADEDIIILGDTNVLGAEEEAVRQYVNAGFVDLNNDDGPTTIRQEPFDRIFVRAGQPEFSNSREEVFGVNYLNLSTDAFLRKLSDHYLVTTSISVTSDDD